jgi:hypothetical protein
MPRITIHVGGHERLEPAITKATPMGVLGTEAIVRLGPTMITGTATALRALADALVEAAGRGGRPGRGLRRRPRRLQPARAGRA